MDLLDHVAARIKDLRVSYNSGEGLSQEALAAHLKVAPNTISRWETGTYRPSLKDLERISRFFGVSMMSFLPEDMVDDDEDENLKALLRTARQLHPAQVTLNDARRMQTEFGAHLSRELFQIFVISLLIHLCFPPFRPGRGRVLP